MTLFALTLSTRSNNGVLIFATLDNAFALNHLVTSNTFAVSSLSVGFGVEVWTVSRLANFRTLISLVTGLAHANSLRISLSMLVLARSRDAFSISGSLQAILANALALRIAFLHRALAFLRQTTISSHELLEANQTLAFSISIGSHVRSTDNLVAIGVFSSNYEAFLALALSFSISHSILIIASNLNTESLVGVLSESDSALAGASSCHVSIRIWAGSRNALTIFVLSVTVLAVAITVIVSHSSCILASTLHTLVSGLYVFVEARSAFA
jgi:hypothetical protein